MRNPYRRAFNRPGMAITVFLVLLVLAGASLPWGAQWFSSPAWPLSDEIAYEGAEFFDDLRENVDPASFSFMLFGMKNPLSPPLACYSLLSQVPPFQHSHTLFFSLRC
jgi:hypothetical protein